MAAKNQVRVRMYRLNELGDCFLISFMAGDKTSHMLIDCGSFRNSKESIARLKVIAKDIKKELKSARIDVVVGTHQHNDHLSGFVHCEDIFKEIGIDHVWLSWLDNPKDQKAREIGAAFNNLRLSLVAAHKRLQKLREKGKPPQALRVLEDILGFYGAKSSKVGASSDAVPPELPAKAVKILKKIGKEDPSYLKPGKTIEIPGIPVGKFKVHILGPPRERKDDEKDELFRKDPRKGESYDHALAAANLSASRFLDAVNARKGTPSREEEQYPFGENYKYRSLSQSPPILKNVRNEYKKREGSWRTIDDDWLNQVEGLALFLDSYTNNSSLVIAIELCETGKVLLFAADAQTGNWASWDDVKWENLSVKTDDLLARTVLYKVGHHGSHNSTRVQNFEKMSHPDLSALIPVHKKDPNISKSNGWKMPAKLLFKRIQEKTEGRVLQMDDVNPKSSKPDVQPAKNAWKRAGMIPKITDTYIELVVTDD